MYYHDFTITVSERQPGGYSVSAVDDEKGRVSALLSFQPPELSTVLARILSTAAADARDLRLAGEGLFRWLAPPPIETHLRLAWDRSKRAGAGLRLRLSIDAPEVAVWPWELLRDPQRDHLFSTATSTLLIRYLDQADRFGSVIRREARPPLDLLLVLPDTPDLDLGAERRNLERVVSLVPGDLSLKVLDGKVTRADLADALLAGDYDAVHFSGHGAFVEGKGYVGLNRPEGGLDWVHGSALSQLTLGQRSLRLVVLNACNSGRVDDVRAFQGLAPQLVRYGVPAVLAMQFAVRDSAAATFSQEFYKCLCVGESAGHVDVAVSYARGLLSVLHPDDASWGAPVLYTNAADGVIFTPLGVAAGRAALDPVTRRSRLDTLQLSLQASAGAIDDWADADSTSMVTWRQMLRRAAEAYRARTTDPQPQVRQVAERGLAVTVARLEALEQALGREG